MKVIALLFVVLVSSSAEAKPFSFNCQKVSGSLPKVVGAVVSGPLYEFDLRVRLFSSNGAQIDTGRCDFSSVTFSKCYSKDPYGNADDHPNRLAVKVEARNPALNKNEAFALLVKSTQGTARFSCIKN